MHKSVLLKRVSAIATARDSKCPWGQVNGATGRLRIVPRPGELPVYRFTLDDLDELAGYVAAEANHAKIRKLEKELRRLYARIAALLESYTDENNGSTD